jgi:hypothetical protein
LDHGQDNCFDVFRLLTTVANNKLKESLSLPWCACGQLVSVELENIVRAACSPIGYQRNWHWTNFKKSVRREYIDFPSHNANLMRFPLTRGDLHAPYATTLTEHMSTRGDTVCFTFRVANHASVCLFVMNGLHKEYIIQVSSVVFPMQKYERGGSERFDLGTTDENFL